MFTQLQRMVWLVVYGAVACGVGGCTHKALIAV